MKKGTCFVGASVIVLFAQLCYANLVVNGGFETDFDNSSTSPVYGSWIAASEAEGVGESDGIIPYEGSRMLHFLNPNRTVDGVDSMVWQLIDVSAFLGEISTGNAIAEMSAQFNRVLGDSQTDTEFRIHIYAFDGNPDSFWSQYLGDDDLAHVSESIFTDGDVTTWELNSAELVLPVNTDFVAVGLQSIENIFNDIDWQDIAFDGHYADAVTLTIVPGPATTYYVDALNGDDNNNGLSKETAFATIQKAIDSAYDGDTVLVADGTYTGPGNRDIDFLGKAITVRSEFGPENCIIDCQGSGQAFHFYECTDKNSILEGFTITNGRGGINCYYDSSPTITNCIISGNSGQYGGGILCYYGSPTINNCTIAENEGAGILCYGSPTINNCTIAENEGAGILCYGHSNLTITNSTINNNTGGVFHERGDSLTITNCTINDNTADWGGGIVCYRGSLTITNSTITGNSAEGDHGPGGGIFCDGGLTIINCIISGNSATAFGGGIFCQRGNSTITNCIITGNSTEGELAYGGAISCTRGSQKITNCTISGNMAKWGGGISCWESDLAITNCILWDSGDEIWNNDTSTISINYSNVQGDYEGEGNIDADPYFVQPGYWADANDPNIIVEPDDPNAVWIDGDYYLLPDSPCIDAGDPNYVAEPNETDLDGNPRVINGRIDMGAYETNYIQAAMKLTPQMLNCNSKGKYVKAHITLPEGFLPEDIDINESAIAEPMGIESESIKVLGSHKGQVKLEICFDREAFCEAITETGEVEITVIGSLTTSRYFYATDTIKMKP